MKSLWWTLFTLHLCMFYDFFFLFAVVHVMARCYWGSISVQWGTSFARLYSDNKRRTDLWWSCQFPNWYFDVWNCCWSFFCNRWCMLIITILSLKINLVNIAVASDDVWLLYLECSLQFYCSVGLHAKGK